jgi:hypothetical protein
MKKVLTLLLLTVLLSACDATEHKATTLPNSEDVAFAERIVGELTYVRDKRTNLCFAVTSHAHDLNSLAIAQIDCNHIANFLSN